MDVCCFAYFIEDVFVCFFCFLLMCFFEKVHFTTFFFSGEWRLNLGESSLLLGFLGCRLPGGEDMNSLSSQESTE